MTRATLRRWTAALAALLLLAASPLGLADTLRLKDGRVLEGRVDREGDDFVFFIVKIGDIESPQMFLKADIESLERDAPKTDPAQAKAAPKDARTPSARPADPNAERVAFITLGDPPHDMVGPYMNAAALEKSFELLEDDDPDIVVLLINSGGGALFEVEKLSDVIQEHKKDYRIVSWIHSAISAAAMTSLTTEEIYFQTRGNFGAATAFSMSGPGKATAAAGEDLEQILYLMEHISSRGGYNPIICRAMQVGVDLSADIDEDGVVTWRNDLEGQHIVSTKDRILTFNSVDAMKYRFARGVADTKDDLVKLLIGDREWVEVGQDAWDYAFEYRAVTAKAELAANELRTKMGIAMEYARSSNDERIRGQQVGLARRYLNELRSLARRSPGAETYFGLNEEFFRQTEEALRDLATGGRGGRR